jgi:hypothetical protein
MDIDYSPGTVSSAAELIRAYTDSVDGNVSAEVDAILKDVAGEDAELRNLVASLAGLAGHAVMVISAQLEAHLGIEDDPERRLERLAEQRTRVLTECARAVREFRPASMHLPRAGSAVLSRMTERRSGLDRRLGSDRRHRAPGNPSERINLQLYGDRRVGSTDRRSGTDRRSSAASVAG